MEPPFCKFDPRDDLPLCPQGVDNGQCFTERKIDSIEAIYSGVRNSAGELIYPGLLVGTEPQWPRQLVPHVGNDFVPGALRSGSAIAYVFYREDPGLLPPDLADVDYELTKSAQLPEWAWWEFDVDDFGSSKMADNVKLTTGTDANLDRFLLRNGGKLLLYHGWSDVNIPPRPTIEYHDEVVAQVFDGNATKASEHMRLFLAPGMNHCGRGVGPNEADYLSALDAWMSDGVTP